MAEELITQVHNPADDLKVKGKQGGGGGWFSWFCGSCKRKGGSTLREHELVASAEVPKPQTINIDFTEVRSFLVRQPIVFIVGCFTGIFKKISSLSKYKHPVHILGTNHCITGE